MEKLTKKVEKMELIQEKLEEMDKKLEKQAERLDQVQTKVDLSVESLGQVHQEHIHVTQAVRRGALPSLTIPTRTLETTSSVTRDQPQVTLPSSAPTPPPRGETGDTHTPHMRNGNRGELQTHQFGEGNRGVAHENQFKRNMPKMDFPKFDGADACVWVDNCETYFAIIRFRLVLEYLQHL